ncbi:hypothetical protein [Streptomyces sp. NPDC055085]
MPDTDRAITQAVIAFCDRNPPTSDVITALKSLAFTEANEEETNLYTQSILATGDRHLANAEAAAPPVDKPGLTTAAPSVRVSEGEIRTKPSAQTATADGTVSDTMTEEAEADIGKAREFQSAIDLQMEKIEKGFTEALSKLQDLSEDLALTSGEEVVPDSQNGSSAAQMIESGRDHDDS